MIGNDIIDLRFVDSPTYQHISHLERVLGPGELRVVRRSADPAACLAVLWSSKEATYKLFSKQFSCCRFVPRQFIAKVEDQPALSPSGEFTVSFEGIQATVTTSVNKMWVHSVATFPGPKIARWAVRKFERGPLDDREAQRESLAVRILAKVLLSKCGMNDVVLEFQGPVPTLKAIGPAGIGISLSHHGAYAAAAIAWPSCEMSAGTKMICNDVEVSPSEEMCSTYTV